VDAYKQGQAAIDLQGLPDGDRPQLRVRDGGDAGRLILAEAAAPEPDVLPSGLRPESHPDPADAPMRVSGPVSGDAPPMRSFSAVELARAELEAAEIVSVRRPAPASRNKVIIMASIGAGLFVLLLLVIPHDIISPPAPVGTPQIVLGASALTACALWALNPRRRYLRFAVSLLVMILVPASPVWPLLSEFSGGAAPSTGCYEAALLMGFEAA